MSVLEESLMNMVRTSRLWQEGGTVIAACSGGADSLTLTDIMAKPRKPEEDDVTVLVAHVHHHLRAKKPMKMPVLFQLSARIGTYPIPNLISIPRPSRKKRASP